MLIEKLAVSEGGDKTAALFLPGSGDLKPSASDSRHSIPLAQTAPEIGPVFVRRSITEMPPPPSSPLSLFPSKTLVVCWVSEVEKSVCQEIRELV